MFPSEMPELSPHEYARLVIGVFVAAIATSLIPFGLCRPDWHLEVIWAALWAVFTIFAWQPLVALWGRRQGRKFVSRKVWNSTRTAAFSRFGPPFFQWYAFSFIMIGFEATHDSWPLSGRDWAGRFMAPVLTGLVMAIIRPRPSPRQHLEKTEPVL
jgi:hypothetical protein